MASNCPYNTLPDSAFWRRAVSRTPLDQMDLIVSETFRIGKSDRIATAGSCFAQNIARYLAASGYTYLVTEQAPRVVPTEIAKKYNYGVFTARYGNLYTTLQLDQLIDRAYGRFTPAETAWEQKGRWYDPFRPQIQPRGFSSREALLQDREVHFAAVRQMLETCDVFVFTLGLTESWIDRRDGAVFPVCPGCGVGDYNPDLYAFENLDYVKTEKHLRSFLDKFAAINPKARVILTVSPVPLIATAETGQHVLVSTMYSKSVLRAVAGAVSNALPHVSYFPSYDLIGSHVNDGAYFAEDKRDVLEVGVGHAMKMFFRHYCGVELAADPKAAKAAVRTRSPEPTEAERAADLVCDEEILDAKSEAA